LLFEMEPGQAVFLDVRRQVFDHNHDTVQAVKRRARSNRVGGRPVNKTFLIAGVAGEKLRPACWLGFSSTWFCAHARDDEKGNKNMDGYGPLSHNVVSILIVVDNLICPFKRLHGKGYADLPGSLKVENQVVASGRRFKTAYVVGSEGTPDNIS